MTQPTMIALVASVSSAYVGPAAVQSQRSMSKIAMSGGKGFDGGEATRDPAPT